MVQPALALAPITFLDDIANNLESAGVQDAVARRDSGPIFDWLLTLFQLQGISDAVAFSYAERHGSVRWSEIRVRLKDDPACHRLKSYWHLSGCGYKKSVLTCSEPHLLHDCPLPQHPLRNGRLNQAAYSLFLFIRDICEGDLVGWIDDRLQQADPGAEDPHRAAVLREALLSPLENIYGVGRKLWSMALADLLLAGDPNRERWRNTGKIFVAVDSLVHSFLHRTGVLHRFGCAHEIGPACYSAAGCASLIEGLAQRMDRPSASPRFIQHSIWAFCAADGHNICNGNRINDQARCDCRYCPVFDDCDRVSLRGVPD
ncbi:MULTISPECIES: hypothetical protein [Microvirga]|uniref:hypothetical protein n=1 Tax=Microvirga TaxID=186650 RepID=UPI0021C79EF9|nr:MULTISPECIES: hypothetical protein [unclassified Microvirga]